MANCTIGGGRSMVISGDATLFVIGDFVVSGSGFAYLAPGASLTLYVGGTKATISGGGVANGPGLAANFSIFCMPTVTNVAYSWSAQFIGTIYAPQAALTMAGSAAGIGAIAAKSVSLAAGMSFHYDERLRSIGLYRILALN